LECRRAPPLINALASGSLRRQICRKHVAKQFPLPVLPMPDHYVFAYVENFTRLRTQLVPPHLSAVLATTIQLDCLQADMSDT
jgi:hypothetical protein